MVAPVITNLLNQQIVGENLKVSELPYTSIDRLDSASGGEENGPLYTTGVINNGLLLDKALGQRKRLSNYWTGNGTFSFGAWLKRDNVGGSSSRTVFAMGGILSNQSVRMQLDTSGYINIFIYDSVTGDRKWVRSNSGAVSSTEWRHFAFTWDSSDPTNIPVIYKNGVNDTGIIEANENVNNYIISNTQYFGATTYHGNETSPTAVSFWGGMIDECIYYDGLWTEQEILDYVNSSHLYLNNQYTSPPSSSTKVINLVDPLNFGDVATVYNVDGNDSATFFPSPPQPDPEQLPREPDIFQTQPDYNTNLSLLIEQYKDTPRLEGIIRAFNENMNDLETAIFEIRDLFWLENGSDPTKKAFGVQLDVIGKIFGVERSGLDDEPYREAIKERAAIFYSGTPEDIIEGLQVIYGATSVVFMQTFDEQPASFFVIHDGVGLTQAGLNNLSPAGVGAYNGNYIISEEDGDFLIGEDGSRLIGKGF